MHLRVAIDANVLIAGIVWPRWQHAILMHALNDDFTLILSPLIIAEAQRHISRKFPEFLDGFPILLLALEYERAPIPTKQEIAAQPDLVRQKEDIPVALSIQKAHAHYFITYDKDFTDQNSSTKKVQRAIPGIMLPPVFLRDVMGWTSEELEVIRYRNWDDVGGK